MRRFVIFAIVAGLALFAAGDSSSGQGPLRITGLTAPRGLAAGGSYLLVADQGNGRILRVSQQGSVGVLTDGILATTISSPQGPTWIGVTSAIEVGGTFYYTVGGSFSPGTVAGSEAVYSVTPGQQPRLVADLGAYERAHNTDGDVIVLVGREAADSPGEPELYSNPYDLVSDGAGGLYVSDSAANAVLHVSATGEISPFAVFRNRPNPLFPALGGPVMDQVPTGLEVGPDGALYVATLTGFPFPKGMARVYRIQDSNGDGDAMDEGETKVYADGVTSATNLAFDRDGSLLVTEFSTDMLNQAPGRLVRVAGGAIKEVVKAPLVSPTGLAVLQDGRIVVSQEFLSLVAELGGLPAGPPGGPTIKPPNTGDGGLLD